MKIIKHSKMFVRYQEYNVVYTIGSANPTRIKVRSPKLKCATVSYLSLRVGIDDHN